MLHLLEVTYTNNKESVAIYPTEDQEPYANETELWSAFETKLGQAEAAEAYKAEMLIGFDSTGRILERRNEDVVKRTIAYHTKDNTITLSSRLVTVLNTNQCEVANQSKKENRTILDADCHKFMGAAMANVNAKSCCVMGIEDGANLYYKDYWYREVETPES